MIVAERKSIPEIVNILKGHKRILVLGCGTCVTVCLAGGEREVSIMASALRIASRVQNLGFIVDELTIERQCDNIFIEQAAEAIQKCEAVLSMGCGAGVQAIAEVITAPGMINVDFADVKAVMKDAGPAWMSIGRGVGQNRAVDAARDALASPILDVAIEGAKAVLYNVVGGASLTLHEVNQAAEVIRKAMDPDANIMFGVVHNPNMENEVRITLIATGFTTKIGSLQQDSRQEEMAKLVATLKIEDELDIPTFLRRPRFSSRRPVVPPAKSAEAPSKNPVSQN